MAHRNRRPAPLPTIALHPLLVTCGLALIANSAAVLWRDNRIGPPLFVHRREPKPRRRYAVLYDADVEEIAHDEAMLGLTEVSERTGLSKAAVRRLAVANRFPPALEMWGGVILWRQSEVEAWIADQSRA